MVQKQFFQAVTTKWSSVPKGKVYGTRKIINIKNGKGYQIDDNLNMTGETIRRRKRTIKGKALKRHITRGNRH